MTSAERGFIFTNLMAGAVRTVWVLLVLVWTPLKWILSLEVLYRLLVAIYHWETVGSTAGWTFLAHFAMFSAITYFVSVYRPKGL